MNPVLNLCATAIFLAGCGGAFKVAPVDGQSNGVPALIQPARPDFKTLYRFKGSPDGRLPIAGLTGLNGTFYGTTYDGGAVCDCGTVFSVNASGTEHVLHSFAGSDGAQPSGGLTVVNGVLYGTTVYGGAGSCTYSKAYECGTVFAISTTGKEKVLHSFMGNFYGGGDGSQPSNENLVAVNGVLYGTTLIGGVEGCALNFGCGTVFSITPAGKEKIIYRFTGGADGSYPEAGLVATNGVLYGTTTRGGSGGSSCAFTSEGCGTVFSVTTSGKEKVIYNFKPAPDGNTPVANLTAVNGVLYGTTGYGGDTTCYSSGCGTVFKVTRSGKENVLHSFVNDPDGAFPVAGMILLRGALYGTTSSGGRGGNGCACGTVFDLTQSGTEKVLYSFTGARRDKNGGIPNGLLARNGALYGTSGGAGTNLGTVFRLSP